MFSELLVPELLELSLGLGLVLFEFLQRCLVFFRLVNFLVDLVLVFKIAHRFLILYLMSQVLVSLLALFALGHALRHHDMLRLLWAKARWDQLLVLAGLVHLPGLILTDLLAQLLVEHLLLAAAVIVFFLQSRLLLLNPLVVAVDQVFIKTLLLGHVLLVPLQRLLPSVTLDRIVVLDHAIVLLRHNIAAIMKRLDCACHHRSVSNKPVAAKVDMPVASRIQTR